MNTSEISAPFRTSRPSITSIPQTLKNTDRSSEYYKLQKNEKQYSANIDYLTKKIANNL